MEEREQGRIKKRVEKMKRQSFKGQCPNLTHKQTNTRYRNMVRRYSRLLILLQVDGTVGY